MPPCLGHEFPPVKTCCFIMGMMQEEPSSRKKACASVFPSNLLSQNALIYTALASTSAVRPLISCWFRRFRIRPAVFLAAQALTWRTASALFSRNGAGTTRPVPTALS